MKSSNDNFREGWERRRAIFIEFYRAVLICKDSGDLRCRAYNQTALDRWVTSSEMSPHEVEEAKGIAHSTYEEVRLISL